MRPRIAIISENTSLNLGDQAIAKAIDGLLQDDFEINFVAFTKPIASSPEAPNTTYKSKSWLKRMASVIPVSLRANIRWYLMGDRVRVKQRFIESFRESRLLVLGGGQLIKNNASLFCNHIATLNSVTRKFDLPVMIVGVGVDRKMNAYNWKIVSPALRSAKRIALRDKVSYDRLTRQLPSLVTPVVIPDLAFSLKNNDAGDVERDIDFALNVMSSSTMLRAFSADGKINEDEIQNMWLSVAGAIIAKGDRLALYTTGALEDKREAEFLRSRIKDHFKTNVELFHPSSLSVLLDFMHRCDRVFASRMHAGILAYISRCNSVFLNWDDKVRGVWSVVDEVERVVDLMPAVAKDGYKDILKTLDHSTAPEVAKLARIRRRVESVLKSEVNDIVVANKTNVQV